eukprot:jgi/Hompol1/141/HPOL_002450-RA
MLRFLKPARSLHLAPTTVQPANKDIPVLSNLGVPWQQRQRPRLVVLGTGWAATTIAKSLRKSAFETIVVSPTNYFTFTPLLPEATTGTVEVRSLVESIRKICRRSGAHYFQGSAQDVDFDRKLVHVSDPSNNQYLMPYDKLAFSVCLNRSDELIRFMIKARNETYSIPGVTEHVHFLKSINDARKIRETLMHNFESASVPSLSQEERNRLLSFVIVGGGPTGVEFAAELFDFLNQDLIKYFPDLLKSSVRVTLIQGAEHILNTFDEAISSYAENRFKRQNIDIITSAFVVSVEKDKIIYKTKDASTGVFHVHEIPYGLCVWSTGIGMHELTKKLAARLEPQQHVRALSVDSHLRVKGVSDVYALGDCATVKTPKLLELMNERLSKSGSSTMSAKEFDDLTRSIMDTNPQTISHLSNIRKSVLTDVAPSEIVQVDMDDVKKRLADVDKSMTSLPATAQVASQQGSYLSRKLNSLSSYDLQDWAEKENRMRPFRYNHLGNFSYLGGWATAFDSGKGYSSQGFAAFVLWRSAYLSRQVSLRTRVLLAWDWTKTLIYGRDISSL